MTTDTTVLELRGNVFQFVYLSILPKIERGMRVLEIGPMQERWTPAYYVPMRDEVEKRGATYRAVDTDPGAPTDYCCDVVDLLKQRPELRHRFHRVIALEVLEHTRQPWVVAEVMRDLLRPGGRVFVSTPFSFRIHEPRPDYWRFTEDGLRALFEPHFSSVSVLPFGTDTREPLHYTLKAVR